MKKDYHFPLLRYKMRMWFRGGSLILLVAGFAIYDVIANRSEVTADHRHLSEGACPEPANPKGLAFLYSLGVLYLFIALAIVADEFFVPALDVISDWWGLSPDVSGATLMAAGGSAPELFTSAVGTFLRSSVGFGAIVGSAVFNILFVVGICAVLTSSPMQLTWYPMIRDASYYCIVLIVLAIFFGVTTPQVIEWWEALILHLMYWLYLLIMTFNKEIFFFLTKRELLDEVDEEESCPQFFSNSSKFRAGIMHLMLSKGTIYETTGTHMVTKISGDAEKAFRKFDIDGDGKIDKNELKIVLSDLKCNVDENGLDEIMNQVDKNKSGGIDFKEFNIWYVASEQRIGAEIDQILTQIDKDNDGIISATEIRSILELLGNTGLTEDDVAEVLSKINHDGAGGVTKENFKDWYKSSSYYEDSRKRTETLAEAVEGISLYPPTGEGSVAMAWYFVTLPLILAFSATLPDVRMPGKAKYAYVSFLVCLAWMGIFSYFMVSWVETIGATAGIPSVIMGLTFLAAGTSVPDMLSALIVAKQGHGDKAVSSSIGSNVFDICIGLAFPWLLFWAVYQEPVYVNAGNLFVSILILVVALFLIIATIKFRGWTLPPSSGYFFIFLYCCFVAQQLALTNWNSC